MIEAPRGFRKLSVSAQEDHADAALVIAHDDGHGIFSRPFQDALSELAYRRFGERWREVVRARAAAIREQDRVPA
jgi:hypothetical protein